MSQLVTGVVFEILFPVSINKGFDHQLIQKYIIKCFNPRPCKILNKIFAFFCLSALTLTKLYFNIYFKTLLT